MVVWGAAAILFALFATMTPGVQSVFKTAPLGPAQWMLAVALAALGTFWIEVRKWLARPSAEAAGLSPA